MTTQHNDPAMIEDLQSRLAFQEDMVDSLNATVVSQAEAIKVLQMQVQHLSKRFKDVVDSLEGPGGGAADERPPHY